jgi:hypothetical protein
MCLLWSTKCVFISQKMEFVIVTAVKPSNLTSYFLSENFPTNTLYIIPISSIRDTSFPPQIFFLYQECIFMESPSIQTPLFPLIYFLLFTSLPITFVPSLARPNPEPRRSRRRTARRQGQLILPRFYYLASAGTCLFMSVGLWSQSL